MATAPQIETLQERQSRRGQQDATGILASSKEQEVGKLLARFVSTPAALATMKAMGFEAP
jgi:hypothetical protein